MADALARLPGIWLRRQAGGDRAVFTLPSTDTTHFPHRVFWIHSLTLASDHSRMVMRRSTHPLLLAPPSLYSLQCVFWLWRQGNVLWMSVFSMPYTMCMKSVTAISTSMMSVFKGILCYICLIWLIIWRAKMLWLVIDPNNVNWKNPLKGNVL